MSFFVEKMGAVNALTDPDNVRRSDPDADAKFKHVADTRQFYADLQGGKMPEFRSVAMFHNVPLEAAVRLLEPDILKNKRKFFGWLDQNPAYRTYIKRKSSTVLMPGLKEG